MIIKIRLWKKGFQMKTKWSQEFKKLLFGMNDDNKTSSVKGIASCMRVKLG